MEGRCTQEKPVGKLHTWKTVLLQPLLSLKSPFGKSVGFLHVSSPSPQKNQSRCRFACQPLEAQRVDTAMLGPGYGRT